MKIVINTCYGGFSISKECAEYMASKGHKQAKAELKNEPFYGYGHVKGFKDSYSRTDPILIEAVETLGKEANGTFAELKVIEIPDGINYYIDYYDGVETVREEHRSWY